MGFYGGVEDSPLVRFHCMTQRRDPMFPTRSLGGRPLQGRGDAGDRPQRDLHADSSAADSRDQGLLPAHGSLELQARRDLHRQGLSRAGQTRRHGVLECAYRSSHTPNSWWWSTATSTFETHARWCGPSPPRWIPNAIYSPSKTHPSTPWISPANNWGSAVGLAIDATTKIGPEKNHAWGEPLSRPEQLPSGG